MKPMTCATDKDKTEQVDLCFKVFTCDTAIGYIVLIHCVYVKCRNSCMNVLKRYSGTCLHLFPL